MNLWREAFEIWRGSDDKQDHHAMMPARVQEAWGTDNRVDNTNSPGRSEVPKMSGPRNPHYPNSYYRHGHGEQVMAFGLPKGLHWLGRQNIVEFYLRAAF